MATTIKKDIYMTSLGEVAYFTICDDECGSVVLSALGVSLALCMFQRSRDQMAVRIEEVYDNLEVRCSVTNLTGTQSDRLNLPETLQRQNTTDITTRNYQKPNHYPPK